MHYPSQIQVFLCALIFAAHTHCVSTHGAEQQRKIKALNNAESPADNSVPCENESGCICKGATLGEQVTATLSQDDLSVWVICCDVAAFSYLTSVLKQDFDDSPESAPAPLTTTVARALLQCFQI